LGGVAAFALDPADLKNRVDDAAKRQARRPDFHPQNPSFGELSAHLALQFAEC
jgi:hypothetical protein